MYVNCCHYSYMSLKQWIDDCVHIIPSLISLSPLLCCQIKQFLPVYAIT